MAKDRPPERHPFIDPITGKIRPLSDEDRAWYYKSVTEMLKRLETMTDETDDDKEGWEEILRNLTAPRDGEPS